MVRGRGVFSFLLLALFANLPFSFSKIESQRIHNQEHIREHMKEMMDGDEDLMLDDDEAMDFHYFKIHDYDNNNKLDGLELAAALTHFHEEGHGHEGRSQSIDMEDSELESLVEGILGDDDLNKDGYIDYYEFKQAQNRKGPEAPEV